MLFKILQTKEELCSSYTIVVQLYDENFTFEKYSTYLDDMIVNNYKQLAMYQDGKLIAVSGFWINTKLFSGKYLEIDNFIVDSNYQSKGIGNLLIKEIEKIAFENDAYTIVLDAFTSNFGAHKFYYNKGYVPKGFHFVKYLNN